MLPLVYGELRKLAASQLAREAPGQTLQPTALVHEAWLRLAGEPHQWRDRHHFLCVAAEAMRRILVDRARRRHRIKHGAAAERVPLEAIDVASRADDDHLLRVHEAVELLAKNDPLKAELVTLRYFAGFRITEAAALLGISPTTAKRHWHYARVWLLDAMRSAE